MKKGQAACGREGRWAVAPGGQREDGGVAQAQKRPGTRMLAAGSWQLAPVLSDPESPRPLVGSRQPRRLMWISEANEESPTGSVLTMLPQVTHGLRVRPQRVAPGPLLVNRWPPPLPRARTAVRMRFRAPAPGSALQLGKARPHL